MSLLRIISGNRLISYSKLLNSTSFITSRVQSTETPHESPEGTKGTGAFADAFNKFEDIVEKKPLTEQPQTFQSLLRQSKFMDVSRNTVASLTLCKPLYLFRWVIRKEKSYPAR